VQKKQLSELFAMGKDEMFHNRYYNKRITGYTQFRRTKPYKVKGLSTGLAPLSCHNSKRTITEPGFIYQDPAVGTD